MTKSVDSTSSKMTESTLSHSSVDLEKTDVAVSDDGYPVVVHFGVRPSQLSYAGDSKYQKVRIVPYILIFLS